MSRSRARNGVRTEEGEFPTRSEILRGLAPLFSAACLVGMLCAAVYGLERARRHVYSQPQHNPPLKLQLADAPTWVEDEGWRDRILASVCLPEQPATRDFNLLADVAGQMSASGWVSRVRQVSQDTDGTIRLLCDYRRPIAMMLVGERFVPIDKDGVRLPELYRPDSVREESGWLRVFGIETPMPEVGQPFQADDARAAVRLASLIAEQEFAPRITGIDVTNYRGRKNRYHSHILLHPRGGKPIEWGSAIGEEIEEIGPVEKLRNIAILLKRGSPQAAVDVSVYKTGWIEKLDSADAVVRTADRTTRRN